MTVTFKVGDRVQCAAGYLDASLQHGRVIYIAEPGSDHRVATIQVDWDVPDLVPTRVYWCAPFEIELVDAVSQLGDLV